MAGDLARERRNLEVSTGQMTGSMTSDGTKLRIDNLTMKFDGLTALDDVSFHVKEGEIFGMLGPNGAGKTTLFNIIAGVYAPTSGSIFLDGENITGSKPNVLCRKGIARTFQITQPFSSLTVEENVMLPLVVKNLTLAKMRDSVGYYIDAVGLTAKRNAKASELSTGQRKRLELARVLASGPKVVLLDEVTGGVDMASIGGLIELVSGLSARGITVVIVEHNMSVMSQLATRLMFLNRGRCLMVGPPREVLEHPDVVTLYLGRVDA